MSDDDFLSRWSRRKRQARTDDRPSAVAGRAPAAESTPSREEPGLTPEELASLPKLDELTVETDISAFLRKGVPDALRNAALRKMWTLDPGIRDFVGHARDYAYDWNAGPGVPGTGALLPTDDLRAMVRQVFGADTAEGARIRTEDVSRECEKAPDSEQHRLQANHEAPPPDAAPDRLSADRLDSGVHLGSATPQADAAAQSAAGVSKAPSQRLRRHGGAKPQ